MKKFNFFAFLTICGFILCLIGYKVLYIPITHDETATIVHYHNYNAWEIMMYPDPWPNNHILNTLITKLFINVGGKEQWVVRLPNLLFFIIYCLGIYRIIRTILPHGSIFVIALTSLFLGNAYLLDFFGLCRGYGMSTALVTLSASYLLSGFVKDRKTDIWWAFFIAILGSYANFTALTFWASVTILCTLYFLIKYLGHFRKMLVTVGLMSLMSLLYLCLIITPIRKMTSTNQFEYWNSNGFYQDTLFSLVENWRYNATLPFGDNSKIISIVVVLIIIASFFATIRNFYLKKEIKLFFRKPSVIAFLLTTVPATVSVLQSWILDTPFLSGRTALFFYPLFSILMSSFLIDFQERLSRMYEMILAFVIAFFFFFHLMNTYSHRSVREWWYDADTFEVLDYLRESRSNGEGHASLAVNWLFHRSFFFYCETGEAPWLDLSPYDKEIDPHNEAEYYYVMEDDVELLDGRYTKVRKIGYHKWLLQKIEIKDN